MKRIMLHPAYVLHRRPYRETSFLVDLFLKDHGLVSVVARGVRKLKSGTFGLLQPFMPLLVSVSGKGDLLLLTHVEATTCRPPLQGDCLFAGFYLNELLNALLHKWDAQTNIFTFYEEALAGLQGEQLKQKVLRSFELKLLDELGYGVLPKKEALLVSLFATDKYYRFVPEHGFVLSELDKPSTHSNVFHGKSLLGMAREDWQDEVCLKDAKRLMRFMLAPLLGNRPILSRELFMHREVIHED